MGMNVLPSDTHFELSHKIQRAVEEHFRMELKRPELLNRVGQNIVVFDFLTPAGMSAIFDSILERVTRTVKSEQDIDITFAPEARTSLKQLCTRDFFDGGRGIANRIETHLINPLARHLFPVSASREVHITRVDFVDGRATLGVETSGEEGDGQETSHSDDVQTGGKTTARRVYPSRELWRARVQNR